MLVKVWYVISKDRRDKGHSKVDDLSAWGLGILMYQKIQYVRKITIFWTLDNSDMPEIWYFGNANMFEFW